MTTATINDHTARAGRREWIGLAVLALPCLLYSMDLTVLNLAVPSLSADLHPSSTQLLWIVDIYGFMVAGSLITMGTLGDRIGRRRLLMIGAVSFGITSILAAFSASAGMLIATRALLGLSGATLAPSTLSLIRNMFLDQKQRTVAISIWITSYSAGAAIAPPVGGLMLEYFWWGSVFLIAVPVMVMLLILGPILLPEFKDPRAGRPDLLSAAMSLGAVLTMIYGLKQIAIDGFGLIPLVSIGVGLSIGALFALRQTRLADPLIDLGLLKSRAFSASLVIYLLGALVVFGAFVFLAQYLQLVLGLSPLGAGLWTMPWAGGFILGSLVTPQLARRFRPAYVMAAGLTLAGAGFVMLTQVTGDSGIGLIVTASVILSIGLAPVFTLATDMMVGTAPPERAGAASAISETCAEFGGAMGIAVLGSIGAAIYRGSMAGNIPAGVSPEAASTARSTLGGAVDVSHTLSPEVGAALLATARDAFAQSMQLTAVIGAVAVTLMAFMVITVLRNVGGDHEDEPSEDAQEEPQLALAYLGDVD